MVRDVLRRNTTLNTPQDNKAPSSKRVQRGRENANYLRTAKQRLFDRDAKPSPHPHLFVTTGGVTRSLSQLELRLLAADYRRNHVLEDVGSFTDSVSNPDTIHHDADVLPRYLRACKVGGPLQRVETLFSDGFNSRYAPYLSLLHELVTTDKLNQEIHHTLLNLYPVLHSDYRAGNITTLDYTLFHDCAFDGHCPDEYYGNINELDPTFLDSNRTIQEAFDIGPSRFLYHGLVLSDMQHVYHKPRQATHRSCEYRTMSVTDLLSHALTNPVVAYGNESMLSEFLGVDVLPYEQQTEPGVYYTYDHAVLQNTAALTCQMSRAAVIQWGKTVGLSGAERSKLAKYILLKRTDVDCEVGLTVGYLGVTKLVSRGKSALLSRYIDKRTTAIERAVKNHADLHATDAGIIKAHESLDKQAIIMELIDELVTALKDGDKEVAIDRMTVLYPCPNPDLLARTRIKWVQLYDILSTWLAVYPDANLYHWLYGTGGLGLHGFAGIMTAATVNPKMAVALHAMLGVGVLSHGYKHYVDTMKEVHAVARRTINIPAPLFRLIDTAAVELDVYKIGNAQFDFPDLNGFDDPTVTYLEASTDSRKNPSFSTPMVPFSPAIETTSPPPPLNSAPQQHTAGSPVADFSKPRQGSFDGASSAPSSISGVDETTDPVTDEPMMVDDVAADYVGSEDVMYLQLLAGRTADVLLSGEKYVAKRQDETTGHPLRTNVRGMLDATTAWTNGVDATMARLTLPLSESLAGVAEYTPTDFLAHFIQIAPAGSIGSDKSKISWLEDKHNATKRTWINSLTEQQLVDLVKTEPRIETNTMSKTEAGKERVLVPGSITHWAIESLCMTYMEKAIYRSSPEFALETDNWTMYKHATKRARRTKRHGVTVASDYADFNFLHTIDDMKKFWRMVAAAARPLSGSGSWDGLNYAGHIVRCAEWLEQSLDKMYVREPHVDGYYHRVTRGLWSGWRSTSAINNTMNYVYMCVLRRSLEQAGLPNCFLSYELNGDDGDAEVTDEVAGLLYLKTMSRADLDVQPAKQLISRYQAEFLRIMYRNGCVKGSLARSIASFVSSDMQSPKVDVGVNYTKGTSTTLSQMIRRGADWRVVEALRTPLLSHYAAMSYTEDGVKHTVSLNNKNWLYVPEVQGGFGCNRFGCRSLLTSNEPKKWPNTRINWKLPGSPNTAIRAMQTFVSTKLTDAKISPTIATLIARDAQQITDAGVDMILNSRQMESSRRETALHIRDLNSTPTTCYVPTAIDPWVQDQVNQAATVAFFTDDIVLDEIKCTDLEERVAGYIGKTLGVMGISRQALSMFRDIDSDERLSPVVALSRLSDDNAWYASLLLDYPETLIQQLLNGTINLPRDTQDVLSPLVQPTLVYVQNTVMRHVYSNHANTVNDIDRVVEILDQINRAYMQYYARYCASTWRE
jgi:hypothetical protein